MSIGQDGGWRGVVAIDGPSAGGKSTLARRVASELGLACLDTGAFYRAAALAVLRSGVDPENETAVVEVVRRASIGQGEGRTCLDDQDVETEIRTPRVTEAASRVAALPGVRKILVERQRLWVRDRGGSAVVEGRDIGSVVFPDAPVKIYLTASSDERARRRTAELASAPDAGQVAESLARRDEKDAARAVSPLRRMPDAMVLDTTALSPDQAAAQAMKMIAALRAAK